MLELARSSYFDRAVAASFKKFDKDDSGQINKDELCAAMAYFYFQMSKKFPGVADPPTITDVEEAFRRFDKNKDDELDFEEYAKFVKEWVDDRGLLMGGMVITNLLVNFLAIPWAAELLHNELAMRTAVRHIPKKVFTLAFAFFSKVGFKLFRRAAF